MITELGPLAWLLAYVFLVSAMLSIGLEVTGRQVLGTLGNASLMGRALEANLVVVPALGLALVRLFPMSPDVAAGLLIRAAAPGAPFAVQFTGKAKGAVAFAAALLLALTLIALVVTPPLSGFLLGAGPSLRLPIGRVARAALLYLVLPLLAGFAIQRWAGALAGALRKPVALCAALSFPAVILLTMSVKSAATRAIGLPAVLALLLLVLGAMLAGWLLGGPDTATRRVLATGTGMRNAVVALLIARTSFPGSDVDLAVLAFSALMRAPPNLVFTVYQGWRARTQAAGHEAPAGRGR
jgi:bile acid:Na+ symporter, BASS family